MDHPAAHHSLLLRQWKQLWEQQRLRLLLMTEHFRGAYPEGYAPLLFFDCTAFDSGVLPGLRDGRISLQEKQIDLDRKKLEKSVGWEKKNDCNFIKKGV